MILDGFKVARNGLGKRRYRAHVIDELIRRFGDEFEIDPADLETEWKALEAEGIPSPRELAIRRLKRGAVLGQVARDYGINIEVTQINRAMMEEARRRSPVEADTVGFLRSNFRAQASVQASILEQLITEVVIEKARP